MVKRKNKDKYYGNLPSNYLINLGKTELEKKKELKDYVDTKHNKY